jgi:hypothetical protein
MTKSVIYPKSPIDSLIILWACCVIDYYKDNRKLLAPLYMRQELGEEAQQLFADACYLADGVFLDTYKMQLTKRGQFICDNWQVISDRIFRVNANPH